MASEQVVARTRNGYYDEYPKGTGNDIVPGYLVAPDSAGNVNPADASSIAAGLKMIAKEDSLQGNTGADNSAADGEIVSVFTPVSGDRAWLRSTAAAIAIGDYVEGTATGRIQTYSSGTIIGVAKSTGDGTANDQVLVEFL